MMFLGESFNLWHVLQYTLNCVMVALVYGLVGFTIASVTGERTKALGIASGFAFVSYLLNSMAPSVSSLSGVDKLLFFHYYQNDPFKFSSLLVLLLAALVLIGMSFLRFNRRDIRAN
jgi:ABC-type transport system involved in multi-copper enzyme maturation permease subunit